MPEKDQASWAGDYRYSVGPAFFVAPLLDGIGARSVVLPFGARYSGWWDDAAAVLEAGATVSRSYAGDPIEIPLFLREGFIVPLDGDTAGAGMSDAYATTLGLPLPGRALVVLATPADTATTFALHDVTGDATLGVSRANGATTFTAEGTSRAPRTCPTGRRTLDGDRRRRCNAARRPRSARLDARLFSRPGRAVHVHLPRTRREPGRHAVARRSPPACYNARA